MTIRLSSKQRADLAKIKLHIGIVRGLQIGTLAMGAGLSIFTDRGIVPAILAAILAAAMNSSLPELPAWLESLRPDND